MARAIYPHELNDPDFQWLVSTFREKNPHLLVVEETNLPVVFILLDRNPAEVSVDGHSDSETVVPQSSVDMTEQREETSEH